MSARPQFSDVDARTRNPHLFDHGGSHRQRRPVGGSRGWAADAGGLPGRASNTLELVQDKAVLINDSVIARVRDYLDPARAELEFLRQLIATDQGPLSDRATLDTALRASLGGVPQVSVVAYVRLK